MVTNRQLLQTLVARLSRLRMLFHALSGQLDDLVEVLDELETKAKEMLDADGVKSATEVDARDSQR